MNLNIIYKKDCWLDPLHACLHSGLHRAEQPIAPLLIKEDTAMDDMFETGLAQRKATLGDAYVERTLEGADDFTRPFQEAMTAWCWGFGWGDDAIDAKTRSMMNLAMIGALGKMQEWELHCRGAVKNGVTREEIRAIIHVVGIYCGVPQALECFRAARKVLDEEAG